MRVDQCVKQIDVSKVINKENMLLRHTSAQNFEVGQLVVVVLEKFFYRWAVKISSTARAFDIIYFHEFLNPWHYLFQHFDVLIYWSQEPSMKSMDKELHMNVLSASKDLPPKRDSRSI